MVACDKAQDSSEVSESAEPGPAGTRVRSSPRELTPGVKAKFQDAIDKALKPSQLRMPRPGQIHGDNSR